MDSAIYTIIGFFSGALTCYYSFKLGTKSTYDAVYFDGPAKEVSTDNENIPNNTDPDQFDWDEYNSIVKNGPEEEQQKN